MAVKRKEIKQYSPEELYFDIKKYGKIFEVFLSVKANPEYDDLNNRNVKSLPQYFGIEAMENHWHIPTKTITMVQIKEDMISLGYEEKRFR